VRYINDGVEDKKSDRRR